jgi:outer membrane protein assembly factor BamB
VRAGRTTTSCRALALAALFAAIGAPTLAGGDRVVPPKIPVAEIWTRDLNDAVAVPPVADASRAYVALRSGHLVAHDLGDGKEAWRIDLAVTQPMATANGLLFISGGNAIQALRGADHTVAWTVPNITTTAPIVAVDEWLIAVTDSEVLAIAAKDGRVIWHKPAGGVVVAPAVDEDHVYVGSSDGTVLALKLATGEQSWDAFVDGGVMAIAAYRGIVYVGGDKAMNCYRNGKFDWRFPIGSAVIGHIAVDEDRIYFTARDNIVRGHERIHGNQRWSQPLRNRPVDGVWTAGHLVFAPIPPTHDLPMIFDANGKTSGTLTLPGALLEGLPPAVLETASGVRLVIVTGGLTNQWRLSLYATTTEPALVPLETFLPDAGAYLQTDPELQPIEKVLGRFVVGDPLMVPLSEFGFPIVLRDPMLEPLTTIPGLQMRPLAPQLPPRREGSGPGG